MRRWLKRFFILLVVLLLTQTPFIYRRYQLGQLNRTIQQLNASRVTSSDVYADYKGALHVHSSLGGHSTGTLAEIIQAAEANKLAFVVMTEHPAAEMDTRALTLQGMHGGVLFINGNETSESSEEHLLTFGGGTLANNGDAPSTQSLIDRAKAAGQLVFIAHPETFHNWQEAHGYDGMEIYNLHANAKNIRRLLIFFDGLWSYRSYPQLLWTRFYESPASNLKQWDALTTAPGGRKVVAIAGNDAHANVGLSFQQLNGKPILQLKLDPYERSFQVVRTHALIEQGQPLTNDTLLDALAHGHCYVSFDLLADATGFRFMAENGAEKKLMGDEIALSGGDVKLHISVPVKSRVVLVRNGQVSNEARECLQQDWTVNQAGVYRLEVYLPQLPNGLDQKPWIISNPIYVR